MRRLKQYLRPFVYYSGWPIFKIAARRSLTRQRILILMYHRVNDQASPFFEVAVNPKAFEKQIRFFRKYYKIIDLNDLNRLSSSHFFERDVVILTFDDGYRDNYTQAFPILQKYRVPATVFLTTGFINSDRLLWPDKLAWTLFKAESIPDFSMLGKFDLPADIAFATQRFFSSKSSNHKAILDLMAAKLKELSGNDRNEILSILSRVCKLKSWPRMEERAMLNWKEVREMSKNGISFGGHTVSHPALSKIPLQEARREIIESKETIEEHIQKPVQTFAFPFGKKEDYSTAVIDILKQIGFEYACSTNRGYEQLPLKTPLSLKRKGIAPSPYVFH
jgi:peptidoglycan/xylan/chitin deacetylase (PgdA/CDA1 family)